MHVKIINMNFKLFNQNILFYFLFSNNHHFQSFLVTYLFSFACFQNNLNNKKINQSSPSDDKNAKPPKKQRKKQKNVSKLALLHEDICYRCGNPGELVLCDKANCTKSYHLKCLKLNQLPKGGKGLLMSFLLVFVLFRFHCCCCCCCLVASLMKCN